MYSLFILHLSLTNQYEQVMDLIKPTKIQTTEHQTLTSQYTTSRIQTSNDSNNQKPLCNADTRNKHTTQHRSIQH